MPRRPFFYPKILFPSQARPDSLVQQDLTVSEETGLVPMKLSPRVYVDISGLGKGP